MFKERGKSLDFIGFLGWKCRNYTLPEILDVDKITLPPAHNGLYQILLAMKYLRSSVNAFDKLIQNNNGVVSLGGVLR